MNILSLFNGISGLHLACDKAGIEVENCYYSEIDKYANQVTEKNYPNDIQLGDVTKWREWNINWASIDLVGAGFPCQAWSVAGQQLGDKDERGMLFWTTLEIIAEVLKHNPKAKFLMENVKMKKEFEEYITHHTTEALGYVEKTLINSALVSAQNRNRYYWTNFKVEQPQDKGLLLRDILEDGVNARAKSQTILATIYKENAKSMVKRNKMGLVVYRPCERIKDGDVGHVANVTDIKGMDCIKRVYGQDGKAPTLTTMGGGHREPKVLINESATKQDKSYTLTASYGGAIAWNSCERKQRTMVPVAESSEEHPNIYNGVLYRKLTPLECERLQTIPDNWTDCVSKTQRYKMIGNGWTIDVIAHILKHI